MYEGSDGELLNLKKGMGMGGVKGAYYLYLALVFAIRRSCQVFFCGEYGF